MGKTALFRFHSDQNADTNLQIRFGGFQMPRK